MNIKPVTMTDKDIPADLRDYVEQTVLPRYEAFDPAHRRTHAESVMRRALELAVHYPALDRRVLYVAAACHDLGLAEGRGNHHEVSARLIRADQHLRRWFSEAEVALIAEAAEDHRASLARVPRTLYGRIVAEADRLIEPDLTLRRTVQYGLAHYAGLGVEAQYERFRSHLRGKYGAGGYLRLWIERSPNAAPLAELRQLIADEPRLRACFDRIYAEETRE